MSDITAKVLKILYQILSPGLMAGIDLGSHLLKRMQVRSKHLIFVGDDHEIVARLNPGVVFDRFIQTSFIAPQRKSLLQRFRIWRIERKSMSRMRDLPRN